MKYTVPEYIPNVFHNLSGYGSDLIIKELGKKFKKNNIGVIAKSKEKYISFNVKINVKLAEVVCKNGNEVGKNILLGFTESYRFVASSLDGVASNLCNTSGIPYDRCKSDRALVNIYNKQIVRDAKQKD